MSETKRVLIVEDDADIARGASVWLSAANYATTIASDGRHVLATAVAERPDAIVLDVRMPYQDGMATLSQLQRNERTKSIPVVMLSASLADRQQALDAGARFFLPKPYEGKDLVAAINAALGGTKDTPNLRTRAVTERSSLYATRA